MPDREKVIRGLEAHAKFVRSCTTEDNFECPYYSDYKCSMLLSIDALALLKEQDKTIASLQSTINKLNEGIQNTANQNTSEETEIPPETLEGLKRNEELLRQKINELYDELISAKRAEIERLEAEIAKMPPFDAEKLAANPVGYPAKFGIACGVEPTKENVDE